MNPALITLCGAAQLVILFSQSRWIEGAFVGVICFSPISGLRVHAAAMGRAPRTCFWR